MPSLISRSFLAELVISAALGCGVSVIASYLGVRDASNVAWTLIRAAFTSVADTAIVPVQDILNLGSEARMNRPGAEHDNWSWRVTDGALTAKHGGELRELGAVSGRI